MQKIAIANYIFVYSKYAKFDSELLDDDEVCQILVYTA